MASTSVPVDTDFRRLVVERALALAREVESTAGAAPPGRVLDRCEGSLLTRGRTSSSPFSEGWPGTPPTRR